MSQVCSWGRSVGEGCQHSVLDEHAWFVQSGSIKEFNYFITSFFSGLGVDKFASNYCWYPGLCVGFWAWHWKDILTRSHHRVEFGPYGLHIVGLTVVSTEMATDWFWFPFSFLSGWFSFILWFLSLRVILCLLSNNYVSSVNKVLVNIRGLNNDFI